MKMRNPSRISLDRRELSSPGSVSGFLGNSQAVTIVVFEEINGPAMIARGAAGSVARTHDERHAIAAMALEMRKQALMRSLTVGGGQHSMCRVSTSSLDPV